MTVRQQIDISIAPGRTTLIQDANGNTVGNFEIGPEPMVVIDGLGKYLGGDTEGIGAILEDALRKGDAVAAARAAARLDELLSAAKLSYAQAERGARSRNHDLSGFRALAGALVQIAHGPDGNPCTDNDRWNLLVEDNFDVSTDRYSVYYHHEARKVVQEDLVTGERNGIGKSRFQAYLTEAREKMSPKKK